MTQPDPTSAIRTPLWLRLTLALSLAANLLIVGVVIGAVFGRDRDGQPDDRLRAVRELAPLPFVMALAPDERRALMQEFHDSAPDRLPRGAMRAQLRTLLSALRSDAFDAGAVTALLADQRDRGVARQAVGAELLVRHLSAMSPAARRAYADRLEEALRRGARR